MEYLSVQGLLDSYSRIVSQGDVQFLPRGGSEQKKVQDLLSKLQDEFSKVASPEEGLSGSMQRHETHVVGEELWIELASSALNSIDKNSKGNSELFEYLKAATEFEDLLYGLEPYYRDHTLHSLWVYLIGEYMLRERLPRIREDLNWYVYNDIERDEEPELLLAEAESQKQDLINAVVPHRDAVWCLIALCHDLGYSLSKLDKLNEKVANVLKHFDLTRFTHVGYHLNIEHQYTVEQFLLLMAIDVRIVPSADKKDVSIKCYRDDATYWRLCRALEKRQHGILSAYLMFKLLGVFADSWIRGPAEQWGLEPEEAKDAVIRGDILFAISQHEFEFAHLSEIGGLAEVLLLADELEEFSRLGRPLQSRHYYDTVAHSAIHFLPENPSRDDQVDVFVKYKVAEHIERLDGYLFFNRKAERLCRIFSLDQETSGPGHCTIKRINLQVESRGETLEFDLHSESSKNSGVLPATTVEERTLPEGKYGLICVDDKIYHLPPEGERIALIDWLRGASCE